MSRSLVKNHISRLNRVRNAAESRRGYLRLDKNENILDLPESITERLIQEINSEFVTSYPEVDTLYKKLAKKEKCAVDQIYLSSGSDAAIKSVFEAFVNPGDDVLMLSPTYAMFYVYVKMFEAKNHEMKYGDDLSFSVEALLSTIKKIKPKLVCIANPNSPTGTIIEEEKLLEVIKLCKKTKSVVLIDEAYYLYYPNTCAKFINQFDNLVVTRTFSKAFGMASARLGFALGSKEMIDHLHKTRPMYETNAYAVKLAEIVLDNYASIKKNIAVALKGKKYLEKALNKSGFSYFKSYSNFVLIDVGSQQKAKKGTEKLFKKRIIVKSGFSDVPLNRCIRINIGNEDQMKHFMGAFNEIFLKL